MKIKCFVQNRKWKNKNLHNLVKRPIQVLIYLYAVLSLVKNAFKSIFRCTCSYNLVFILIQVDMINNDHIVQVLMLCMYSYSGVWFFSC